MLILLTLLAFPLPLLAAVLFGLRAGRSDPQTAADFARAGLEGLGWLCLGIFTWHALWLTSLVPAPWQDTLRAAFSWTLGTGAFWLPIFGISYVWKALKMRRTP